MSALVWTVIYLFGTIEKGKNDKKNKSKKSQKEEIMQWSLH